MNGMNMMLKSMGVDMGQVEKVVDGVRAIAASLEDMQRRLKAVEEKQDRLLAALEEKDGRKLAIAKCG